MSDKLTTRQERFVQNMVKGMTQRQAYKDAFNVNYDENAIDSNASTLFNSTKVQQRYKELMGKLEEEAIMSAKERMIWLTEVVKGVQKEKEAVFTDGDIVIKDVEANLSTKIKAVDTLNKMTGEYKTILDGEVKITKLEDVL